MCECAVLLVIWACAEFAYNERGYVQKSIITADIIVLQQQRWWTM